ncbi:hypothetical protein D3C84_695640 [compost metagenome]
MNSASSSRSKTCSSRMLRSSASSDQTVPGTTVQIIASAARPLASRKSSGTLMNRERGGRRPAFKTPQATARLETSTSRPTMKNKRRITPGRRMRIGRGRNLRIINGAQNPSTAPSSRLPGLIDRFSTSHNNHSASDNQGAGNRRLMAAPPRRPLWLPDSELPGCQAPPSRIAADCSRFVRRPGCNAAAARP